MAINNSVFCPHCGSRAYPVRRNNGLSGVSLDPLINQAIDWACPVCKILIDLNMQVQASDSSVETKQFWGLVGIAATVFGIAMFFDKLTTKKRSKR